MLRGDVDNKPNRRAKERDVETVRSSMRNLMSKEADIEALMHFLNYSELEAKRLGLSTVVVGCLRIAAEELATATLQAGGAEDSEATRTQ
jgi:transcription initiation factor TFIID subunit TAF12